MSTWQDRDRVRVKIGRSNVSRRHRSLSLIIVHHLRAASNIGASLLLQPDTVFRNLQINVSENTVRGVLCECNDPTAIGECRERSDDGWTSEPESVINVPYCMAKCSFSLLRCCRG